MDGLNPGLHSRFFPSFISGSFFGHPKRGVFSFLQIQDVHLCYVYSGFRVLSIRPAALLCIPERVRCILNPSPYAVLPFITLSYNRCIRIYAQGFIWIHSLDLYQDFLCTYESIWFKKKEWATERGILSGWIYHHSITHTFTLGRKHMHFALLESQYHFSHTIPRLFCTPSYLGLFLTPTPFDFAWWGAVFVGSIGAFFQLWSFWLVRSFFLSFFLFSDGLYINSSP